MRLYDFALEVKKMRRLQKQYLGGTLAARDAERQVDNLIKEIETENANLDLFPDPERVDITAARNPWEKETV